MVERKLAMLRYYHTCKSQALMEVLLCPSVLLPNAALLFVTVNYRQSKYTTKNNSSFPHFRKLLQVLGICNLDARRSKILLRECQNVGAPRIMETNMGAKGQRR